MVRARDWWLRANQRQLFLAYASFFSVVLGVVNYWLRDYSPGEAVGLALLVGLAAGWIRSVRAMGDREELRRAAGLEWTSEHVGRAWRAVHRARLPEDPELHPVARRLAGLRARQLRHAAFLRAAFGTVCCVVGVLVAVIPASAGEPYNKWGWAVAAAGALWVLLGVPHARRRREQVLRLAR